MINMKNLPLLLSCLLAVETVDGANIVWVSDRFVQAGGSDLSDAEGFAAGVGPYADDGFVALLQGAGHTVTRYNPPASTVPAGDVAQLNTYDLVILGRALGSGAFDAAVETVVWNTQVTVPILATNTYLTRSSRLGWFSATTVTQPDQILNPLTFTNPVDPVQAYLIGSSGLSGSTTVDSITTAITYPNDGATDTLGISNLTGSTINAGGSVLATSLVTLNGQPSPFIATLPAGTVLAVTNGAGTGVSNGQTLGGFRMQFLAGNREGGAAPNNGIRNAGFDNLTPEGEAMFLRAVELAANGGVVPIPEPGAASMSLLALAACVLRRRR
jgi:hypothetical protein